MVTAWLPHGYRLFKHLTSTVSYDVKQLTWQTIKSPVTTNKVVFSFHNYSTLFQINLYKEFGNDFKHAYHLLIFLRCQDTPVVTSKLNLSQTWLQERFSV